MSDIRQQRCDNKACGKTVANWAKEPGWIHLPSVELMMAGSVGAFDGKIVATRGSGHGENDYPSPHRLLCSDFCSAACLGKALEAAPQR